MTSEVATRPATPNAVDIAKALRLQLSAREDALLALLPPGADVDRFVELIISTVVDSPELLKCTPESIVLAVREAAGYGLEPTGLYGGAYLVPRWNKRIGKVEATFQMSYRGLLELVWRSDRVLSVECHLVYTADDFRMTLGTTNEVWHVPALTVADRGPVVAGYMVATLQNAPRPIVVPMTRAEIDKVMRSVPDWQKGPWASWWEQMALKTILRNGVRFLPMAVAVRSLISREDRMTFEPLPAESRPLSAAQRAQRRLRGPSTSEPTQPEAPTDAQDGPSGPEVPGPDPETPPAQPVSQRPSTAVCGTTPPDDNPLDMTDPCTKPAGHRGAHQSEEGTFPA